MQGLTEVHCSILSEGANHLHAPAEVRCSTTTPASPCRRPCPPAWRWAWEALARDLKDGQHQGRLPPARALLSLTAAGPGPGSLRCSCRLCQPRATFLGRPLLKVPQTSLSDNPASTTPTLTLGTQNPSPSQRRGCTPGWCDAGQAAAVRLISTPGGSRQDGSLQDVCRRLEETELGLRTLPEPRR